MATDTLIPPMESVERRSPIVVSTFNLSATIVGGAVLALPMAFSKCGVALGTILMVFAAVITDRSLYLLCLCGRLSGATSYGEVGKVAFGQWMEYFVSFLLFLFLLFVLVGYMVLISDIWTSIVDLSGISEAANPDIVLLVALFFLSPFLFQRTLYALRFNCYVGFFAVSMLCAALCHHALTSPAPTAVLWWSSSFDDTLFAFPIVTLSFLSIFNILPIQSALIRPTRARMGSVIGSAVGSCFVLMQVFAVAGYLYAGSNTQGNILLNCDQSDDWLFFVGRLGCGVTILFAMPMMLLPCRSSLMELLDLLTNHPHVLPGEEIPLVSSPHTRSSSSTPTSSEAATALYRKQGTMGKNTAAHVLSTVLIISACYVAAIRVPGVAFVWSLCGSSMAFVIAFLLPAACFLQIDRRHPSEYDTSLWRTFSWFLVVFSIVGGVACTAQTIIRATL